MRLTGSRLPGGGPDAEQQRRDPAGPQRHRGDVADVDGDQQPAGRLRARVPGERGGHAQERGGDGGGVEPAAAGRSDRESRQCDREPRDLPQSPHRPEAGFQDVADHTGVERVPERGARRRRALKDDPGRAGDEPGQRRYGDQPAQAGVERVGGCGGGRGERRTEGEQGEQEPADDQRGRGVGEEPHRPRRGSGHGPGVGISEEVGDARGRRRPGVADAEHETARDRVGVGGDDAVRGGVRPVAQIGGKRDADRGRVAARTALLAGVDLLPGRVEHPDGPEAGLDRFVEVELDRLGRLSEVGAALGHGPLEDRVAERRRGHGGREGDGGKGRHDQVPSRHQPPVSSAGSSGFRSRRRRTTMKPAAAIATAPRPMKGAAGKPESSPNPGERPLDRARLAAHLDRDRVVEDLRRGRLVGHLRRDRGGHPVRPVVVPGQRP